MTPEQELEALLASVAAQGVKIVRKDQSKFWKLLAVLVKIVTFGKNSTFGTQFTTTIGKTIAVTPDYDSWTVQNKLETITHEMVHVGQYKRYSVPVMALLYFLVFIPFGLAYFRYRFEREAYLTEFKYTIGKGWGTKEELIDFGVQELSGSDYGWAWVFKGSIRKWFEANLG